ncbi:alanine/glycine:cation symporter family protein [Desulfoluna spongiiphila]|uniref:Alanine or glycine:cation symporter, AGCS family n=1 Tax=Desulfoluna spongiiphila TaxID=419481 RepID=A0A1G5H442_9BACT|nr:sodium:alanine symporter family protein [Desulfoluna spongiiphila]SCY58635.1 alanine or glycine:cation symporter, AGCS family [Desulfoluna spongiiphila]VVS94800.1 sodium:alanine symporter [Desulfoluna spongiiphila]
MENFIALLDKIDGIIWGIPLLVLLVGTGLWLTISLRGIQFTTLLHSLYLALVKRKEEGDEGDGDISHFQALMTALSATVGTGNIAGVATAIALGGPGAMFWMWVTGLVGMATKYAEAVLAVKYREKDENGNMCGGPMYYITNGLGWKWMGVLFALFASIAAFGIGNMVQSNSVADAVHATFNIPVGVTGVILMIFVGLVVIGGIKSIGKVTSVLVPIMIVFYIAGSLIILIMNAGAIPAALTLIIKQAFSPTAATGGFAGAGIMLAVRMGVARGVFSNESGLGSAPIAAAAAQTKHSVTQALVSMTQTFIDTIIVCSMTGLVLVITGTWSSGKNGAELTTFAFQGALPGGGLIVTIGLILFAYSTILGWCYYGEKSIEYLFGEKAIMPYRVVFVIFVGIGATLKLNLVWTLADIFNGLMAFPNLIALLALTPIIISETKDYFDNHYKK